MERKWKRLLKEIKELHPELAEWLEKQRVNKNSQIYETLHRNPEWGGYLSALMCWDDTPQGHETWAKLADTIKHGWANEWRK